MKKMMHALYIGNNPKYKGKTALVREDPVTNEGGNFGLLLAQFDDLTMKEAYEWNLFERKDFNTIYT